MKKNKMINGLMFGALISAAGAANAAITAETTIDFTGLATSSISGFANNAPVAGGNCAGTGSAGCFNQNGMVVGIVEDASNATAHLHRNGTLANRKLGYYSDSSGVYIRALDSSAFSLTSLNFFASAGPENPDANGTYIDPDTELEVTGVAGANDYWEILGYSSALNPGLDTAANSGDWIVKKTITNGFSGTVLFDDNALWKNISAFWIHYNGYQQTPADGKQFGVELDNVKVNAAVTPAAVPVPAAVWMFGTGLLGLISFGRKKSSLCA